MAEQTMRKHMQERFGEVFNYSMNPPLPKSLNIELNNTCNQACVYCAFHGSCAINPPKPAVMELSLVKKILDKAAELGIGSKEVGFYLAGEVFLYKDFPEVIAYAKSKGFPYTFVTSNGALAKPDKLKAVIDAGLDSLRFSVNAGDRKSYKEIHQRDDFDTVVENLTFLRDYKKENNLDIATSVSCVITKKNYDERHKMKDFFSQFVDDVVLIPIGIERLKNREKFIGEYAIYEDKMTPNPDFICPMLFDTMYINAEGMVMPCCNAYDYDCTFADIKDNLDLKGAWEGEVYRRYRSIFVEGASDEGTICKICTLRNNGMNGMILE